MTDVTVLHRAIAQLTALTHTDFDAEQVLTALCDAAGRALDVDGVGVMSSDGLRTRFVDVDVADVLPLQRLQEGLQQGPCRASVEAAAPVAVADLHRDGPGGRWPAFTRAAAEVGVNAVLAVPLLARGRAWGTLDLYRRRAGAWTAQEVQAGQLLADVAVSYLVLAADRDAARVVQQHLAVRSLHDDLTGLPNRSLFVDRLEHALHTAHRGASTVAVIFVDLDRFKQVNDTFGHAGGDVVLTEVSRRMSATLREDDTLARLAGDEFVLVCTDLPAVDPGTLQNVLAGVTNRLRAALRPPVRVDGVDVVVTASIGVAIAAVEGTRHTTAADLLREADTAMYAAKAGGRDRVHLRQHPAGDRRRREPDLGRELTHALDRDEFRVHYQPIVDSTTRRVHAVEALLRWQTPRHGLLASGEFLDLAVRGGELPRIGHWLLRRACADLAGWRERAPAAAPDVVFCNLSAVELADPQLGEVVEAALLASGLEACRLGLEIVEDDLSDPGTTPVLRALHEAGHPLALDDFGTGYSSLSRLVTLPVTVAKIDKAFTAGLPHDPRCRALVDAVLLVAHSLGLRVVAEGVETGAQAAHLRASGCEYLQGHHESVPVPADDLLERLLPR